MSMTLVVNDANLMVNVYDFDTADWTANTTPIPDAYTIQFEPSLDEATLATVANGRLTNYVPQLVYTMQTLGDAGYMSVPSTIQLQQLLPVAAE
jgi:hypothetical protein